jgi:hypothetical protein
MIEPSSPFIPSWPRAANPRTSTHGANCVGAPGKPSDGYGVLARRFDFNSFAAWTSIFAIVFFLGHARAPTGPILLVNHVFFLLVAHAGTIAHEIAHALVARAVGLRVGILMAGSGPFVVDRMVRSVLVQIGALPGGGVSAPGGTPRPAKAR